MLYLAHLQLFLVILLAAGAAFAQAPADTKPVTKGEIFETLEASRTSDELLKKANVDLIKEIGDRGVDFVLTPEEEWQLEMRDASEDLLAAIRGAIDPVEREARITADRQQRLYTQFASNYNSNDLAGRNSALTAAREFVSLYSSDPNVAEIVTFMQRNLPRLEQSVVMMEQREAAMQRARAQAVERQRRMEEQRQERDRRRRENAEAAAGRSQNDRNNTNRPANRAETKEEVQTPRQPSDPVTRPRVPITRRP